jgi:hypothetical protein
MKKIILGLILVLGVSVAFAGDGPFPHKALVGNYKSNIALVTLRTGLWTANAVQTFVTVTTYNGAFATGSAMHGKDEPLLIIPIKFTDGRKGLFVARAIANEANAANGDAQLKMSFTLDNARRNQGVVFDRVP